MIRLTKIAVGFGLFLIAGLMVSTVAVAANEAETLQPASATKVADVGRYLDEYSSYMQLVTVLHSTETMHLPNIHIGSVEPDVGGVTYFNGTIRNIAKDASGGDTIPVTFGDDVRIDGRIWRGETEGPENTYPVDINDTVRFRGMIWGGINKGVSTSTLNMDTALAAAADVNYQDALVLADSIYPALTAVNDIGRTDLRMDEVWLVKLQGENSVDEPNLNVTNDPTNGYILSYASNGQFTWVANNDGDSDTVASLACSSGQVAKWNGTAWACAEDENDIPVTYQSAADGGLTIPASNPLPSQVITGRVRITANADYPTPEIVQLPTSFFTSEDTYTVTATYETENAPINLLTEEATVYPINIDKVDGDTFNIHTRFPVDSNQTDPMVSWQAIGY